MIAEPRAEEVVSFVYLRDLRGKYLLSLAAEISAPPNGITLSVTPVIFRKSVFTIKLKLFVGDRLCLLATA